MSRKDMIMVAVLVNVGVLILLFVSSLKPAHVSEEMATSIQEAHEPLQQELPVAVEAEEAPSIEEVVESAVAIESNDPSDILAPFLTDALTEIKVKKGDTLGGIAHRYGVSLDELMKVNNLTSSSLQINQLLYIPNESSGEGSTIAIEPEASGSSYYTVKSGDNPWHIAIKNDIKVDTLLQLNGLTEEDSKKLQPGDRLRIR